ncbi:transglutaminase-like domain-containing protein [Caulobacter segnis]
MRIRAGFEIFYECPAPTPMLLMLNVRPEREADLETPDTVHIDNGSPISSYLDGFGNRCSRVVLPAGRSILSADFVIRDSGAPDPVLLDAQASRVEDLPPDVLVYLLGSRYCETDTLSDLAWSLFGDTPPGWARVQAIVDYTHQRIAFGYAHARATKSAWQANQEQRGVCRDFAHLAITLCRCMNIPARYCTGYLGDIGVPPVDAPMDFSAWFEAYLDGGWRTFDARHNTPRVARILIARGRDATDAAITTSFGPALLQGFVVRTDQLQTAQ